MTALDRVAVDIQPNRATYKRRYSTDRISPWPSGTCVAPHRGGQSASDETRLLIESSPGEKAFHPARRGPSISLPTHHARRDTRRRCIDQCRRYTRSDKQEGALQCNAATQALLYLTNSPGTESESERQECEDSRTSLKIRFATFVGCE